MKKQKVFFLSCICFAFFSCKKLDKFKIDNLNGDRVSVIGHAACGFSSMNNPIPDNSMTGIRKAIAEYGAEGVELDVQMSSDSVLYLYHDSFLSSSTNMEGCIYFHTSSELNSCTYMNTSEKLATLEECYIYFSQFERKPKIYIDTRLVIECDYSINYANYCAGYAEKIYQLVKKYDAESYTIVESRDFDFLNLIKAKSSNIDLYYDGTMEEGMYYISLYGYKGIIVSNRLCTKEQIKDAHDKGIYIGIFEAFKRSDTKKAIEKSPDFIQTDNILQLQQLLNDYQ